MGTSVKKNAPDPNRANGSAVSSLVVRSFAASANVSSSSSSPARPHARASASASASDVVSRGNQSGNGRIAPLVTFSYVAY
jgi:hypothetical protein